MKIKWTDGMREVPFIGILNAGDIKEVPPEIGQAYIDQGQAVAVEDKKKFIKEKEQEV